MLKDNLIRLRNARGYSQEQIAEKVGVSRQAYARWENGSTVPDIEKSSVLAEVYGVTLDSLTKENETENPDPVPSLPPPGKIIWGSVTMTERGQIVIPKAVRNLFGLTGGQRLIVLSDEDGIALVSAEIFEKKMKAVMDHISSIREESERDLS